MIIDPQASQKFDRLVLEEVGADARQVIDGSISVAIDGSRDTAVVTWQGIARISREDLARITEQAQA